MNIEKRNTAVGTLMCMEKYMYVDSRLLSDIVDDFLEQYEQEVYDFLDDEEKMRDFKELSKEEFLESYSYLTEEEYDKTMENYKK